MNLNEASQKALEIAEERGIHENTMEALKHCAGEVLEAVDAYDNWSMLDNPQGRKEEFENELADVIICILSISGAEKIDIEYAISRKMLINESRTQKENYKEIKLPKVVQYMENGDFLCDDLEGNKYRSKDGRNWELEKGEENDSKK